MELCKKPLLFEERSASTNRQQFSEDRSALFHLVWQPKSRVNRIAKVNRQPDEAAYCPRNAPPITCQKGGLSKVILLLPFESPQNIEGLASLWRVVARYVSRPDKQKPKSQRYAWKPLNVATGVLSTPRADKNAVVPLRRNTGYIRADCIRRHDNGCPDRVPKPARNGEC